MTERKLPPAPKGAGRSGRRLWNSLVERYEFDVHEELNLALAVDCIDRQDAMAAEMKTQPLTVQNVKGDMVTHPLIVEMRQQAILFTRLMASLRLPDEDASAGRPQRRGSARGAYSGRIRSVS